MYMGCVREPKREKNHHPCRLAVNKLDDVLEWDEYAGPKSRQCRVREVRAGEEAGGFR